MLAFLYEHGPWVFHPEATTLSENPWSWNKVANVIYLEAPAGVGFSLVGDPSNWNTNDYITAHDNL
jgi:cathepsin A (carboxypeptidase C)